MDVNIKRKAFKESVFKAYDVRGLYPEELDHNTLELIADGYAEYLRKIDKKTCVLGRDTRWSSEEISAILEAGLLKGGIDVIDIGEATTPLHLFSYMKFNGGGGIMVTASHNPIRYNGLKINNGLGETKEIIKKGIEKYSGPSGRIDRKNFINEYITFLLENVSLKKEIRAVFDTGGGAVNLVLPKVLKEIKNIKGDIIFPEIDPSLSKREPNPLLPSSQEKIKEEIIKNKADAGFLFDPDGDRVVVFDEEANAINGDAILWLLAHNLARAGDSIVYDAIRSSRFLAQDLGQLGVKCFKSRVGHTFIKEEMRLEKAVLGGEISGHYYFRDFFFSESSILAMLKILEIISSSNQKLSSIVGPYFKYFNSGEINLITEDKGSIIAALEEKYKNADRDYFDGVMFRFKDWWFSIRPSNTEDYLRFVLEADNKDLFNAKKDEVLGFILSKGARLA